MTGIRTKQLTHYWIGECRPGVRRLGQPGRALLPALCVNAEGSVGDGYAAAVAAADGELTGDGDDHAAQQRLACYRHFEAPTSRPRVGRRPSRRSSRASYTAPEGADRRAPADVCPTCHTQLPATKVCDNYCT